MSSALFAPGLALATEVFKFINAKESKKYIDRIIDLELNLLEEESKPLESQSDRTIEDIIAELKIIQLAATRYMKLKGA